MSLYLDALHCKRVERPPVWLMRQAGRTLPPYQKLRQEHPLEELFCQPELSAYITELPIHLLGVDAAILFSDILMAVLLCERSLSFVEGKGPCIAPLLAGERDMQAFTFRGGDATLDALSSSVGLVKERCSSPLIGLSGGPFTVATYLFANKHAESAFLAKHWMKRAPLAFHHLLEQLTQACIAFIRAQVDFGVDAMQIFDSWSSLLEDHELEEFSLPYLQKMIRATSVPTTLFARGSSLRAHMLIKAGAQALSFDWEVPISHLRRIVPPHMAVQGNFNPSLLLRPKEEIVAAALELLASMEGALGYIVNLGHGVLPQTPLENLQTFVQIVKSKG